MRNINRFNEEKFSFGINDVIKDSAIALAFCLMLYFFSRQIFIFILFIPFFIAAVIGDLVRKYTRPNAISTRGSAWKVLNNKIYWSVGPQIEAIILSVFLFYIFAQSTGETSSSENQEKVISDVREAVSYRD